MSTDSVITAVSTRTIDGEHYLVLATTDDNELTFAWSGEAVDFIEALDIASVGIDLTPRDDQVIAARIWNTVVAGLKGQPLRKSETNKRVWPSAITQFTTGSSVWDNGRFPDGSLTNLKAGDETVVSEDLDLIESINAGALRNELRELGGNFRGEDRWELTLVKTADGTIYVVT